MLLQGYSMGFLKKFSQFGPAVLLKYKYRFYSAGSPTERIKIRDYGIYSVISFYIQILASIILFIISLKTMYNLETEKWLISKKLPNPICKNRVSKLVFKTILCLKYRAQAWSKYKSRTVHKIQTATPTWHELNSCSMIKIYFLLGNPVVHNCFCYVPYWIYLVEHRYCFTVLF